MSGRIILEKKGAIARITIDRPEKLNAMTPEMIGQLAQVCSDVDRDTDSRVVVLQGSGDKAFSAGSDLNSLADRRGIWEFRNRVEYAKVVRDLRKPVIAALKGWVLGGGLDMALSADIRIAAQSARLGSPEVKRGWLTGGGASQMLPRLAGYGRSMMLLLSGEPIDAETAWQTGLVEEVVDDAALSRRVDELANVIASFSPIATQAIKAATRAALSTPLEAGLAYENELHVICMQSRDAAEGIAAFREKRPPHFTGS